MPPLYALTARTAADLKRLIQSGEVGREPSHGSEARGVTWVKVTGAAVSGWHPGVVSLDDRGEWSDLTAAVKVASADGSTLTTGERYLCTRTGDATDATARFRAKPGSSAHFPARTTSTYSAGYSWERRTLTSGTNAAYSPSQTGTHDAYTPDDDQTLPVGTDGYIFRDGAKWVFIASPHLAVEDADGSPSYAGIRTIRFDQADGFTITNPAAGVARIDFAGASLSYGSGGPYDDYTVSGSAGATNILSVGSATPLVLPGHGTYLVTWSCKIHFAMPDPSDTGAADSQSFSLKWKNNTDAVTYSDYFAGSSQLTASPLGAPGDTIWDFCASRTDVITVSAGSNAAKDFHLLATSSGAGGSGTISEVRVTFLKLA